MKRNMSLGLCLGALLACAAYAAAPPSDAGPIMTTVQLDLPENQPTSLYSVAEVRCVQRTVFGEARNQKFAAQVAVAATIVNRSLAGTYPADLCRIVKQSDQYYGYSASVALTNDAEIAAWDSAVAATEYALYQYGSLPSNYRQALYFASDRSGVGWHATSKQLKTIGRLDGLIFYSENGNSKV